MKLSYQWLKEFVPIDVTPKTLAEEFTMKAAEVESVEEQGRAISKVVVGEILEIKPHPEAQKLQLAKVSTGEQVHDIVCGAKNIRVGQKVPTALLGATLPEMKIEARKIRGIESQGMLCSSDELGLPGGVDGILVLDPASKVGTDVRAVLGLDDAVLDVKVLADRSYLRSHIGAARDIAAIRNQSIMLEEYGRPGAEAITGSKTANPHVPNVMDPSLCPRYSCVVLSNLQIAPSPAWLASRLARLGVRPVNNLVDLTNYVMLELGQPMHAFDRAKLAGSKVIVRPAKRGERLECLDGVTRELDPDTLVIADQDKVLAVAGVIGGTGSEISATTSGALIESANFQPRSVRRTSQRLKVRTEASSRFEHAVDPNLTAVAIARLVELLPRVGLQDAQVSQLVDAYSAPLVRQAFAFDPKLTDRLVGVSIPATEQARILQSLGMVVRESGAELLVTPPSFRADVSIPADLVDEVARIYGYAKVPRTLPTAKLVPQPYAADRHWSRKAKNVLRGAGFTEIETYSFVGAPLLASLEFDPAEHIALVNPMSPEQAYLRASLVPNLLDVVRRNLTTGSAATNAPMHLFELGRTFSRVRKSKYPAEPLMLCCLLVSADARSRADGQAEWDSLVQTAEQLVFHFGLDVSSIKRTPFAANPALHPGRTALLSVDGADIGSIGEVHPKVLTALGIDRRVVVLDLKFDSLTKLARSERRYTPISQYPAVVRDLSIVVGADVAVGDVVAAVREAGGSLVRDVELFDRYTSGKLKAGERGYAFHVTLQSDDRTLSDKDVSTVWSKVEKALAAKHVSLR